jgi:hypothetical protein
VQTNFVEYTVKLASSSSLCTKLYVIWKMNCGISFKCQCSKSFYLKNWIMQARAHTVPKICQCRRDNLLYSDWIPNIFGRHRHFWIYLVLLPNIMGYPDNTNRFWHSADRRTNFQPGPGPKPGPEPWPYCYCVQYKCTLRKSDHKNMSHRMENEIIKFLILFSCFRYKCTTSDYRFA